MVVFEYRRRRLAMLVVCDGVNIAGVMVLNRCEDDSFGEVSPAPGWDESASELTIRRFERL